MPAKRRAPARAAPPAVPKARASKLAKENDISASEEQEIKEAFALFAREDEEGDEKEGVIPIGDVRKAMIALAIAPTSSELPEFISILDPDESGYTNYPSFLAICALKMRARDNNDSSGAGNEELEEAFRLMTGGGDGPIMLHHLRRVAGLLKEEVPDDMLRDMILEGNGGAGVGKGVDRDGFEQLMKRVGVFR